MAAATGNKERHIHAARHRDTIGDADDVGNGANGAVGFEVLVGGGLGRAPMIGQVIREFLPLSDLFSWWWGYWLPLRHRPGHAMRMPGPSSTCCGEKTVKNQSM